MPKRYNISKPENYQKDGQDKTYWANVGTMVEFEKEGKISRIIEIPAIGLKANVFEQKPRDNGQGYQNNQSSNQSLSDQDPPEPEDINPDDLPF